jgi:hypothetical protein
MRSLPRPGVDFLFLLLLSSFIFIFYFLNLQCGKNPFIPFQGGKWDKYSPDRNASLLSK